MERRTSPLTDEERRARHRGYVRKWDAANPAKRVAIRRKHKTGFTQEDWDSRFVEQGGLCAICRSAAATDADHDHATRVKRGLLCGNCNRAIGLLRDDPLVTASATRYLERWKAA